MYKRKKFYLLSVNQHNINPVRGLTLESSNLVPSLSVSSSQVQLVHHRSSLTWSMLSSSIATETIITKYPVQSNPCMLYTLRSLSMQNIITLYISSSPLSKVTKASHRRYKPYFPNMTFEYIWNQGTAIKNSTIYNHRKELRTQKGKK